jgi:hypothetical protein
MDKDGNRLNYINNAAAKIIFNQDLSEIGKDQKDQDQIPSHSPAKR